MLLACLPGSRAAKAEKLPTDTLLTRYYNRASGFMEEGRYEEAQQTFDSAFALPGAKASSLYPILLNEQATLMAYVGKREEYFRMKKSVLPYLPHVEDPETRISVYTDLAIAYRHHHINDSTFYYYNKALEEALEYGDESWIAHIYNNIAVAYSNIPQLEEAEKYAEMAARHAVKTDDVLVTFSTWQLRAGIKNKLGKSADAEQSIRKAWKIACGAEENADTWKMRCIPMLIKIFEKAGKPDSVEHYLQLGNGLLEQVPPETIAGMGFVQVRAAAETARGNYAKALEDCLFLRDKRIGTEPHTLFTLMAACYHGLGNDPKAYAYMDSARMWTDTLAQHNLTRQMAEFNVKYQTQEKELQIARLEQEQLRHQAILLKASIVAGLLLAGILIAFIAMRHKKRMAEKKIEWLKREGELNAARRYIEGLEEECKHFAKELHDGIANDLLGLQMKIESSAGKEENGRQLATLVNQLRNNVRNISHELMPPEFERLSLDEILEQYAGKLAENTDIRVDYHPTGGNASRLLPNETAYELYRITQEVTMNIVKHAEATHIDIRLKAEEDGKYSLQIADNGKCIAPSAGHSQGIGLRTVNDRIKAINATVERLSSVGNNLFNLQINI